MIVLYNVFTLTVLGLYLCILSTTAYCQCCFKETTCYLIQLANACTLSAFLLACKLCCRLTNAITSHTFRLIVLFVLLCFVYKQTVIVLLRLQVVQYCSLSHFYSSFLIVFKLNKHVQYVSKNRTAKINVT